MVCQGCRHTVPQTGWLTPCKLIFSPFWRLKVHHQCAGRTGFFGGLFPRWGVGRVLAYVVFLLCVHPCCLSVCPDLFVQVHSPVELEPPHPQQPHLAQSALSSSAVPTRGTGAGGSFNICIARGMDSAHNRRRPVVPGCTCRIATGGFLSTSPRVFVCSILLLQNPFFLPGYPEYTHFPKHIQAHLCQEPNSYVFSHLPSPLQWTPASVHTRASLSLKT